VSRVTRGADRARALHGGRDAAGAPEPNGRSCRTRGSVPERAKPPNSRGHPREGEAAELAGQSARGRSRRTRGAVRARAKPGAPEPARDPPQRAFSTSRTRLVAGPGPARVAPRRPRAVRRTGAPGASSTVRRDTGGRRRTGRHRRRVPPGFRITMCETSSPTLARAAGVAYPSAPLLENRDAVVCSACRPDPPRRL
jgi:hypothetical protein